MFRYPIKLVLALTAFLMSTVAATVGFRDDIITHNSRGEIELKPVVGRAIVEKLETAMGTLNPTTQCRLEHKHVVCKEVIDATLADLERRGFVLDERDNLNLSAGARAGTFTFYGSSLKFVDKEMGVTSSIKLRMRAYLVDMNGKVERAAITKNHAFLEIKIKNPRPEYPLSVHKYRLLVPDEDLLMLILADAHHESFATIITELKRRAHARDRDAKNHRLIEIMFDQIYLLAIADPHFIRPTVAISYYRTSKKCSASCAEMMQTGQTATDEGNFEITIDKDVKAHYAIFSWSDVSLDIEKYFPNDAPEPFLLARYPKTAHVIEFKQPNAVGYEGPGIIRSEATMFETQRVLYNAFVARFKRRALLHSTPDKGKYAHVMDFVRIMTNKPKHRDYTFLKHGQSHAATPRFSSMKRITKKRRIMDR